MARSKAVQESLWGEDFKADSSPTEVKSILNKIKNKTTDQIVKSKTTPLSDKLNIINAEAQRVLGRYKDRQQVIKTRKDLHDYITAAVEQGIIAIDTETNNSLDPYTCKLMGLCIYTPKQKQAYVPVNHTDTNDNRLEWQVTEDEIREELERLGDTKILTHNGSFDYEVIKCTTGYSMHLYWDTLVGSMLLDENERSHGLKQQYISKIDPSIEKYSIDSLFSSMPYAYIDPDIFSLYSAADAYMTYKLYEYQKNVFELPENRRLYDLFMNIEMPVLAVAIDMEMTGVCIDQEYAKKLADYYHKEADKLDIEINSELDKLKDTITAWRLTEEANYKPPKKKVSKNGETLQKSKNEQLEDPIKISSSTQLAILMYDILKLPPVDKDSPRGTGEEVLEKLGDKFPLGKAILKKRGLLKLLNTFVEAIPARVSPRDNRLHAHFNVNGTKTGRFSSSEPNLYNWRLKLAIA